MLPRSALRGPFDWSIFSRRAGWDQSPAVDSVLGECLARERSSAGAERDVGFTTAHEPTSDDVMC